MNHALFVGITVMLVAGCGGTSQERSAAPPSATVPSEPASPLANQPAILPAPVASAPAGPTATVILPSGTKLDPGEYSAFWGVSTNLNLNDADREIPVIVRTVQPEYPAALSGVMAGATILSFNGKPLRNPAALYNAIRDLPFESASIPFVMKTPDGEVKEGTTFVVHIEVTSLKVLLDHLKRVPREP